MSPINGNKGFVDPFELISDPVWRLLSKLTHVASPFASSREKVGQQLAFARYYYHTLVATSCAHAWD